jgi:predicted GNAT family acetyltransferase
MCRIHGLNYAGECVAVLEQTPDGLLTVYSDDGVSGGDHIDIERLRTHMIDIVQKHQSRNMHTSRHAVFVCDDIIDELRRTGPGGAA